jgi:hypothetical protein
MHRHLSWPAAIAWAILIVPSSAAAAPVTVELGTPGARDWTVPAGVDEARFELVGGEGGTANPGTGRAAAGGKGARVAGTVAVTAGETLSIVVAGAGTSGGAGGFGGGGSAGSASRNDLRGAGGGGASSVGRGATALMVAGGGGGGGSWGAAGGAAGASGAAPTGSGGHSGGGGQASAGGAGGAGGVMPAALCANGIRGAAGGAGTAGAGGSGADSSHQFSPSGGGGGGGWFGGGGGGGGPNCPSLGGFAGAGGGGGGSSHLDDAVPDGTIAAGDRAGNGLVTITFDDALPPVASPLAAPAPGPGGWNAEDVSVSWNWADEGGAGVDAAGCQAVTTSAGDGVQTLTGSCADTVGNVGDASHEVKVDATPPEIEVDAPVAGEYRQGQAVDVAFACTDATSGVASCAGSTADGAPLETAVPGPHRLTVTATDVAGNEATVDVDYTVLAPPAEEPPAEEPPAETVPAEAPPLATTPAPAASASPPRLTAPRLLVFRPAAAIECHAADTCRVVARRGGRVLARGSAAAGGAVRMRLTTWGRRVLARQLGGARVRLRAVATQAGERRAFVLRRRAVLGVERAVTPPGAFAADSARLTAIGRRFAARLRAVLPTVARARCDGYAAGTTLSRTNAYEVSLARARRICGVLAGVPTRVAGHGTKHPRVNDRSESGRAVNRRVVITLYREIQPC